MITPDDIDIDYYETHPDKMAEIDRAHAFWNAMFKALADNVWKYQIRMTRQDFEIALEAIEEAITGDGDIMNAIDFMNFNNLNYDVYFSYAPADAKAKIEDFWKCQSSRWDALQRTIVWGVK
jgi:hypothetical protein